MAFDIKAAMAKVPEEKRAALEAALKESQGFLDEVEALSTKLEAETTARTTWEAEKATIEKNWQTASQEYSDVVDSLDATQKEKKDALDKLQKAEADKTAAQAKLAEALKTPEKIDTSKFVTQEEANKLEAGRAAYFAKVLRIQRDHQKLFPDQDLDPEKFLMDALAAKKGPQEYWEETYKVSEKREAIAKAEKEKADKENFDKGYQKAIEETRNPALRTLESSDEPFYTPKGEKQEPWDQADQTPADEQAFLKELSKTIQ